MNKSINIFILDPKHSTLLFELLSSSPDGYNKYFSPFDFTLGNIQKIINDAKEDRYYGISIDDKLVGFYMLRGFDNGYSIPSYGVWIDPRYNNLGLATLSLYHAISICRIIGVKEIMLKVHPENIFAKKIYERCGFEKKGFDNKNGNIIYYKSLTFRH